MSLFVIPKRVATDLKNSKGFPLGRGALVNKLHLLSWSIVCLEEAKKGLSFRNLSTFNKTLLEKRSWRFAIKRYPLWKRMITDK